MPDIRVRYIVDHDSFTAAQAAMHSLTKEEQQAVNEFKKLNSEATKAGKSVEDAGKKGQDSMGGLNSTLKTVGGAIAGYFSVQALISFGKQVISVTSEFQKLQAVLSNALGSDSAGAMAFKQIQDYAVKSNRSVLELADSYVKLVNRGFKPTTNELRKLDDLANSTGKSFDQLTEALLDSFTGENERLKEFGITAKKTGETTQFTFKGVTTEVKNTDKAVKEYILSLGDLKGVVGSTAAISATLGGQISNLGDSFDKLLSVFGKTGEGVITRFIKLTNGAITAYLNFLKTSGEVEQDQLLDRLGKQADLVEGRFEKLLVLTKKSNGNVALAIFEASSIIQDSLEKDLAKFNATISKEQDKLDDLLNTTGRRIQTDFGTINLGGGATEKELDVQRQTIKARQSDAEAIKEQLRVLASLREAKLKELNDNSEQVGLLAALEAKMKEYQKAQKDAFSKADIDKYSLAIKGVKQQIEDLLRIQSLLGNAQNALSKINDEIQTTTSKSRLADLLKQQEVAQRDIDKLLGKEKEFELKKLEISQDFYNQTFGLRDIFLRRVDSDSEYEKMKKEATDEFIVRKEVEKQERINAARQASFDLAVEIGNGLFQLGAQQRDEEAQDIERKRAEQLKRVGDDKQAQAFINAKFDRQEAAIKTRQAKADKDQALFNIAIQTAQKIIQVYPNPVLIALAAATGAVQAALVAARPLPKFALGTERVEGAGTSTSDSILARLSVGERVVPEAINRKLAGIPNIELPKIVSMGYEAMLQKANVSGTMNNTEVVAAIEGLRKDLKKIPHNSINLDERGFKKYIFSGNSTTEVLNNQFNK